MSILNEGLHGQELVIIMTIITHHNSITRGDILGKENLKLFSLLKYHWLSLKCAIFYQHHDTHIDFRSVTLFIVWGLFEVSKNAHLLTMSSTCYNYDPDRCLCVKLCLVVSIHRTLKELIVIAILGDWVSHVCILQRCCRKPKHGCFAMK